MSVDPLALLLQTARIPHALLLVDAQRRAVSFAKELLQTNAEYHPDLHQYYPEGKSGMHAIETLRGLMADVALSPFQAKYKVFIIHEADRMLPTSAHALLKTLEEPSAQTVIILVTQEKEKILPTLISRCQTFYYNESAQKFEGVENVLQCLQGDLSGIKDLEKQLEQGHQHLYLFLELVMRLARDALLLRLKVSEQLLFFPEHAEQLSQLPIKSLERLEKRVRQARLGFERSVKPEATLRYLFSQI